MAAGVLAAVPSLVDSAPTPAAEGQLRDGTGFRVAGPQLFLADRAGRWTVARDGVYETRDGKRLLVQHGRLVPDGAPARSGASGPAGATGPPRAVPDPSGRAALPQGTSPGHPPGAGSQTVSTPPLTMSGVGGGLEGRHIVATGELRMTGEGGGQGPLVISTGELTMTGIGQ